MTGPSTSMLHWLTWGVYAGPAGTRPEQPAFVIVKDSPKRADDIVVAWSRLRRLHQALAVAVIAALAPLAASAPSGAASDAPVLTSPGAKEVVNQPYFRWEKVPRATQYQVEIATDSRFLKVLKTEKTDINRFIDTTTWPAGSYWWRVKVTQPFESDYSATGQFTRRWLVPSADGSGIEVARPDSVTVEDVSDDPGLQVAANRFKISWEPVADASDYEVAWYAAEGRYGTCVTGHTVLTPSLREVAKVDDTDEDAPPNGAPIEHLAADGLCVMDINVGDTVNLRVRALDATVDGRVIQSLWSDEARSDNNPEPPDEPPTLAPTVVPDLASVDTGSAKLEAPESDSRFVDTPTLEWDPVNMPHPPGLPVVDSYRVVLARDTDFTTVIARIRTSNTRWAPIGRLPEDDVDVTLYWLVVPCYRDACLTTGAAVNRSGRYRTFIKHSLTLNTRDAELRPAPWLQFSWEPYMKAVRRADGIVAPAGDSVGGIQYYEVQWRPVGGAWQASTKTDLPDWLPTDLPFGQHFQWRVRIVDGSGQTRPWSDVRTDRTPSAVPGKPVALQATRSGTRLRLSWRAPETKYFPVTEYAVYWSKKGKRWKPVTTVQGTTKRFKVNKRARYWFMVTAKNRAGEGSPKRVYVPR